MSTPLNCIRAAAIVTYRLSEEYRLVWSAGLGTLQTILPDRLEVEYRGARMYVAVQGRKIKKDGQPSYVRDMWHCDFHAQELRGARPERCPKFVWTYVQDAVSRIRDLDGAL